MKLTEVDRKVLTDYIGEKYHAFTVGFETGGLSKCSCGMTGCMVLDSCAKSNRTFTTHADLHTVYSAMVRKDEWREFYHEAVFRGRVSRCEDEAVSWLFCLDAPEQIPARMKLVVEWINQYDQR